MEQRDYIYCADVDGLPGVVHDWRLDRLVGACVRILLPDVEVKIWQSAAGRPFSSTGLKIYQGRVDGMRERLKPVLIEELLTPQARARAATDAAWERFKAEHIVPSRLMEMCRTQSSFAPTLEESLHLRKCDSCRRAYETYYDHPQPGCERVERPQVRTLLRRPGLVRAEQFLRDVTPQSFFYRTIPAVTEQDGVEYGPAYKLGNQLLCYGDWVVTNTEGHQLVWPDRFVQEMFEPLAEEPPHAPSAGNPGDAGPQELRGEAGPGDGPVV